MLEGAVSTYGPNVTISELITAGVLADYWAVAGALGAAYVAGVCVSCTAQAAAGGVS